MKKIAMIIIVTIFLCPPKLVFAKKMRLTILLPITGVTSFITKDYLSEIKQTEQHVKSTMEIVLHNFVLNDVNHFQKTVLKAVEMQSDVIIAFKPEFEDKSVTLSYMDMLLEYSKYRDVPFVIPFSNMGLEKAYTEIASKNVFILPDKISNIILYLAEFFQEYKNEKKELTGVLKLRQEELKVEYLKFGNSISKVAKNGIIEWEQNKNAKVSFEAGSYLEESFKYQTIGYMKRYPSPEKDYEWIERHSKQEITQMLDAYYAKTGMRTVTIESLKASGVNGCNSDPCKLYCCPEYLERNDPCLEKLNCREF